MYKTFRNKNRKDTRRLGVEVSQLFGVRRPVGALVGCDLTQPSRAEMVLWQKRGARPPGAKAVTDLTDHRTAKMASKDGLSRQWVPLRGLVSIWMRE